MKQVGGGCRPLGRADLSAPHVSRGGGRPQTHNPGGPISGMRRPPVWQTIDLVELENGDRFDVK